MWARRSEPGPAMTFVPDLPCLLAFTLAGVVLFATPGRT
jgi:hypothetical protein